MYEPDIHTVGDAGIYVGNDTNIEPTVKGGSVEGWNGNGNSNSGIMSGNNLGDGAVIDGVRFVNPQNSDDNMANVNIKAGDYHTVQGCVGAGKGFAVNGSNSISANNVTR